jgi:hypothetical protein
MGYRNEDATHDRSSTGLHMPYHVAGTDFEKNSSWSMGKSLVCDEWYFMKMNVREKCDCLTYHGKSRYAHMMTRNSGQVALEASQLCPSGGLLLTLRPDAVT